MHLDLTSSPFWPFRVNFPPTHAPSLLVFDYVMQFHLLMQHFFSGYTYVFDPAFVQALWSMVFFFGRYREIAYNHVLTQNSANAHTTLLQGVPIQGGHPESLFLKFMVNPGKDDVRIDASMAFVLRECGRHLERAANNVYFRVCDHLMDYVETFQTFVHETGPGSGLGPEYAANFYLQLFNPMALAMPNPAYVVPSNVRSPHYVPLNVEAHLDSIQTKIVTVFATHAISGISLRERLRTFPNATNFEQESRRLMDLFQAMRQLGAFGFIHNDCHLNNILYDAHTARLRLIDYGRSYVDPSLLPAPVLAAADAHAMRMTLNTLPTTLGAYAQSIYSPNPPLVPIASFSRFVRDSLQTQRTPIIAHTLVPDVHADMKRYLFMYDVATITWNLLNVLNAANPGSAIYQEMTAIREIARMLGANFCTFDLDTLIAYLEHPTYLAMPPYLQVLFPGLFWISLVLSSIEDSTQSWQTAPVRFQQHKNIVSKVLVADTLALSKMNYIYRGGFQFHMDCCNAYVFQHFKKVKPYLDHFFTYGTMVSIQPGGGEAPPLSLKSKLAPPPGLSKPPPPGPSQSKPPPSKKRPPQKSSPSGPSPPPKEADVRAALRAYVSPLAALPPVGQAQGESPDPKRLVFQGVLDDVLGALEKAHPTSPGAMRLIADLERLPPFKV